MTPGSARLLQQLGELPTPTGYWLALSGGLDSVVLLHLLNTLRDQLAAPLHVIHCNHGLQPAADEWAEFCTALCRRRDIPCHIESLALTPRSGESIEAQARAARYRACASAMGARGMLLSAHHQDDQAETLLLQLLRGAGVAGLAAMPALAELGEGWLARPLLAHSRAELEAYACHHRLDWIEDPSNQSLDFDRNFLRHQVMPLLQSRWPAAVSGISRSAALCGEARHIVQSVAQADLACCRTGAAQRLSIPCLQALPVERRAAVLRAWVSDCGLPPIPHHKLQQVFGEVITARADATPLLAWQGAQLRRYRDALWLMPPLDELADGQSLAWPVGDSLSLPAGLGEFKAAAMARGIDRARWDAGQKEVRFRSEGLTCTPSGRQGRRPLKKLFQELGVPPWLRARVPLLFIDGELAAVADYLVCAGFAAAASAPAMGLQWQAPSWLR